MYTITQTVSRVFVRDGYTTADTRYGWQNKELNYKSSVTIAEDINLPQFLITGHIVTQRTQYLSSGNYSRLSCKFIFARQIGFYVIQIYLPSTLIVIISWVSFWLSRDATPARVSLGVTTVLTMTTLMTTTNAAMPKVSYIKSIDIYLGTCFIMVFASLLEYAAVGYLNKHLRMKQDQKPKPQNSSMINRTMKGSRSVSSSMFPSLDNPATINIGGFMLQKPTQNQAVAAGGDAEDDSISSVATNYPYMRASSVRSRGKSCFSDGVRSPPSVVVGSDVFPSRFDDRKVAVKKSFSGESLNVSFYPLASSAQRIASPNEDSYVQNYPFNAQQEFYTAEDDGYPHHLNAPRLTITPAAAVNLDCNCGSNSNLTSAANNTATTINDNEILSLSSAFPSSAQTTLPLRIHGKGVSGFGYNDLKPLKIDRPTTSSRKIRRRRRLIACTPSGIDKYSRVIFPALFIFFNAMYWCVSSYFSNRLILSYQNSGHPED